MKKTIFVSFVILLLGCTKEINSGKINTGSIENSSGENTYLPLTKGSYWQYKIKTDTEQPSTSYIEIRKPLLFTYIIVNRQDFYTAKNIGIIKNVSNIVLPTNSTTTTNITGYKIN